MVRPSGGCGLTGRSSVFCNTQPNSGGPGGRLENSPALQCWVSDGSRTKSRQGRPAPRANDSVVPAGLGGGLAAYPALKCWAILSRPCGTDETVPRRCKNWAVSGGLGSHRSHCPGARALSPAHDVRPRHRGESTASPLARPERPGRSRSGARAFTPQRHPHGKKATGKSESLTPIHALAA